ncbi:MAG TPA: PIN domain-containing protein [Candidatus Nanoarchaeia archaeon]|nr:PIN domain-containing protein [Candidatus Nanoarchaeia archaeon]
MIRSFFFDTYAFCEMLKGSVNYEPYSKGIKIITTKLNLMEFHYFLLLNYDKETADRYYDYFAKFTIAIEDEAIKKASEIRMTFKHKKLSYIDCLGYVIASFNGVRFLTGDKQFEGMDNVEFVK